MAAPFRLSLDARQHFKNLYDNKHLLLDFDAFYFCLIIGLAKCKINTEISVANAPEMVDDFPGPYRNQRDYIIALFLSRELKRLGIEASNKKGLNQIVARMLMPDSKSKLTNEGVKCMNQYAAMGFDVLKENIPNKPVYLEAFLQSYVELVRKL